MKWYLVTLLILALLAYGMSGIMDGGNLPSTIWNFVTHLLGG